MSTRPFIVAIDGPAGAGKSTVSKILARRMTFSLVDTGAIYRCVALRASQKGIPLDDDARLQTLLGDLHIAAVEDASDHRSRDRLRRTDGPEMIDVLKSAK